MRGLYPMRNTYTFINGVRISSEFESGNLWRCEEFPAEFSNDIEEVDEEEEKEGQDAEVLEENDESTLIDTSQATEDLDQTENTLDTTEDVPVEAE